MLYSEIIADCSDIRIKHINTLCGQNVEFSMSNLEVHIVTSSVKSVSIHSVINPIGLYLAQEYSRLPFTA
jgi:hypothetical protein